MADSKRLPIERPDETALVTVRLTLCSKKASTATSTTDTTTRSTSGRGCCSSIAPTRGRARTSTAHGPRLRRHSAAPMNCSRRAATCSDQGRTDAARQLLAEAIAASGDDVQSAALRAQLERRERAQVLAAPMAESRAAGSRSRLDSGADLAAADRGGRRGRARRPARRGSSCIDLSEADRPATVVRSRCRQSVSRHRRRPEVALVRARALVARGRLAEALQKLDGVPPGSPERVEADSLRVEIQQLLLASVRSSSGSAPTEAVRR